MKKFFKRSLVMTLVTVLLIGTFAISADAVAKKTVKPQKFVSKTAVANKKAATVKKGTTNLTFTKGQGYVKFVAPSTKTYSFTFSDLKQNKKYGTYTSISVQLRDRSDKAYMWLKEVSTKGGKNDFLCLNVNNQKDTVNTKNVDKYLRSRTAKIKLKKGDVIYFHLDNSPNKTTCKLVIK